MTAETTRDAFLGGRVMLTQPKRGYRAGVDPVLLAAACPAKPGERVLDLGCGVGAAALCLSARVPGLHLTGVERQPKIAALARQNAVDHAADFDVVTADLADLPGAYRQMSWDHVITNPPYFDRSESIGSAHTAREAAMGEETPLSTWVDVAARRLKPKGWLTLIHRAERLDDLFISLAHQFGSLSLLPLAPRTDRPARLMLIRARKEGRAAPQLLSPLVLHKGAAHTSDEADYTDEAEAILRCGAAISRFND